MRIFELARDDSRKQMPHLYLDMDGVQADFFGHWAKEHGVKHYKAIPHPEEAIQELATSSPERVYNFFRDLEPLNGGNQIVAWLKSNGIPFTVLSAPLRGPYSNSSIKAKKDWLDQYNPGTSDSAIFTGSKFKYAMKNGKPNVLVDDFGKYLKAWSDAGGIPVKHEDGNTQHTIDMLEKIYSPYINKNTEK
jgi:hypothetical protein